MPEELDDKTLKRSYWFVTHREAMKSGLIYVFSGFVALIWLYVLAMFVNLYLIQGFAYRAAIKQLGEQARAPRSQFLAAQDLAVKRIGVVPANDRIFDLYAEVVNPNPDWRAELSYAFVINGRTTQERKGFIMPGESKFFLQLNTESTVAPSAEWKITSIQWKKMSGEDEALLAEKYHLATSNFSFTSSMETGITQIVPISMVSFDLKNSGGYTYSTVGLPIVLLNNDAVVAVNYITTQNVTPGETRALQAKWFHQFDGVTAFKVTPEVNVFDPTAFR